VNNTASNMHKNKREYFDAIFVRMDHDKADSLLHKFIKNNDFVAVATIRRKFIVVVLVSEHL